MKKLITIILAMAIMLIASTASAVIWKNASLVPIAWDAVTTLENGNLIPAGDTVNYVIYIVPESGIADADNQKIEVGQTTDTTFNIVMENEGNYYFGGKAERLVDGAKVSESAISWSFVAANTQGGEEMGIVFYLIPANMGGFR